MYEEFRPELGKIYYLEIGNPGLSEAHAELTSPGGFEYQGKMGLPDSDLYE